MNVLSVNLFYFWTIKCHILHKSGQQWVLLWPDSLPGTGLARRQNSAWMFSAANPDVTHLITLRSKAAVLCSVIVGGEIEPCHKQLRRTCVPQQLWRTLVLQASLLGMRVCCANGKNTVRSKCKSSSDEGLRKNGKGLILLKSNLHYKYVDGCIHNEHDYFVSISIIILYLFLYIVKSTIVKKYMYIINFNCISKGIYV